MKTILHKSFIFCFFITVFLLSSSAVWACSCGDLGNVDESYSYSANIVVLKLQSLERFKPDEPHLYSVDGIKNSKLSVEKVYKGSLKSGDMLTFRQGAGADCVWGFTEENVGTEYLLYLGKKPKDNVWMGSVCSRSSSVKGAAADILYLDKLDKVAGRRRLSGRITQEIAASISTEKAIYNGLSGKKVEISGGCKTITVETDANGVYEVYDLPAGKCKITPEKVAGYRFDSYFNERQYSVETEIKPQGHTEYSFNFEIDNAIRETFLDANGNRLKDVHLNLIPAHGEEAKYFYQSEFTNVNGEFNFTTIPAGTYVIVINKENKVTADQPFSRFYYPNVAKQEDAMEITIGAGEVKENLIVKAPQTEEVITISGKLLYEDGQPVVGESVEFYQAGRRKPVAYTEEDSRAQTGKDGTFSIRILKGENGILLGSMTTYKGQYENCPKLDKLIKESGTLAPDIETAPLNIETKESIANLEIRFPFPGCKRVKGQ